MHDVLRNAYDVEERESGWWYVCRLCPQQSGYSNKSACFMYADRHVLHTHINQVTLFDQDVES